MSSLRYYFLPQPMAVPAKAVPPVKDRDRNGLASVELNAVLVVTPPTRLVVGKPTKTSSSGVDCMEVLDCAHYG